MADPGTQVPIVVFEDFTWKNLLPLTYLRASFQLVCGMGDLLARIRRLAGRNRPISLWCRSTMKDLVGETTGLPVNQPLGEGGVLLLNGRALWRSIPSVQRAESNWVGTAGAGGRIACIYADTGLAARITPEMLQDEVWMRTLLTGLPVRDVNEHVVRVMEGTWDVVLASKAAIADDWPSRVEEAGGQGLLGMVDAGSYVLAPENVHMGEGTRVLPCTVIDAEDGPVYIGNHVKILPHCYIQGPAYIGDHTLVQHGATVRDGCYIGPVCKVGGEIDASIIHSYSNKQHDGFLGHSYVGCWVNIAADCVTSDLKNTYGTVRVPVNGYEVDTGEQFVGSVIGDHSKVGINVSIPTGAVIGFCSSVFAVKAPKFTSSFLWITGGRLERYDPQRALAVARKVMARRKQAMSQAEEQVFLSVLAQALAVERTHDSDGD